MPNGFYIQNVAEYGPRNHQRRPDTGLFQWWYLYLLLLYNHADGDHSSSARQKFISNICPDIFLDTNESAPTVMVLELLEKASTTHDSESGYATMTSKDFPFNKGPTSKVRYPVVQWQFGNSVKMCSSVGCVSGVCYGNLLAGCTLVCPVSWSLYFCLIMQLVTLVLWFIVPDMFAQLVALASCETDKHF